MHYVYILLDSSKKHWYTGCTSDLTKRLQQHNQGKTRSTKPYRPWKVVYFEKYQNKSTAYKREFYFKSPGGYLELKAIKEKLLKNGRVA